MLLLTKSTNNTIVVTLLEKTTLTTPYYLFEFIDDGDNSFTCIAGANTSGDTNRYDRFIITEQPSVTTADRQSGKIYLEKKGFYKYRIYEQASATNLLTSSAGAIVERGKAYVAHTPLTEYLPVETINYKTP